MTTSATGPPTWLNLVERWFKELTDKRLRRGTFKSVAELIDAIEHWADHWSEPFEWRGFRDPRARRRRWEKDGYLGDDDSLLVVALLDGTFAGIVVWSPVATSGPQGCFNIGILLFPEHRGKGLGTAAQRLLADYLFSTTLASRLEATTEVDNVAEQRALEWAGFLREGVLRGRGFVRGQWRDGVMYARLRNDTPPQMRIE